MKKNLLYTLPFFCMFLLATGSVVLSCVTVPNGKEGGSQKLSTVNTVPDETGAIYTTWRMDDIKSVIVINFRDKSKKMELSETEWAYDKDTTRLRINRDIPFPEYVVHIEGINTFPNTFILRDMADRKTLLVALEQRVAIEGYDYTLDDRNGLLTFRDDIDLHDTQWMLQYDTPLGMFSFGEWTDGDWLSYIEANQRKKYLDTWYDSQDSFYFFEDTPGRKNDPSAPPALVKRPATPEEFHRMKSYPISVLKFRGTVSDRELSKELGFKVSLPENIPGKTPGETIPLSGKIIGEYAGDNRLVKKLHANYLAGESEMVELTLSKTNEQLGAYEDAEYEKYLISRDTVDLGLPVARIRSWGTQVTGLNDIPRVISITEWKWESGGVYYSMSATSDNDSWYERIIADVIHTK